MLTLNELAEVAGVSPQHLRNWISEGVIVPTVPGGKGPGHQHRFSLPAAVGVLMALRLQQSARSCAVAYCTRVAKAFAGVTTDWLREQMYAQGNTHLVMIHNGRPLLAGKGCDWPDVRAAFEAAAAKLEEAAAAR